MCYVTIIAGKFAKDWKTPKQFLLGLRQPLVPHSWEYDDNQEDNALFVQALQAVKQQV